MSGRERPRIARRRIDEMIEEATVDCYGEDEQHDGAEWIEVYRVWLGGGGER